MTTPWASKDRRHCLAGISALRPNAWPGTVASAWQVHLVTLDEAVAVGDWVLVRSGFALWRLREEEAYEAQALIDS